LRTLEAVSGVAYWLRTWRWRRWVGLGIVATLAAGAVGFVLLAGLGARRADTAWDRLRAHARDDDVLLDTGSVADARALTRSLRSTRGVAETAAVAYAYLVPKGRLEDFYGGTILAFSPGAFDTVWRPALTVGQRRDGSTRSSSTRTSWRPAVGGSATRSCSSIRST
jgi:hypothetical protein